MSARARVFWPIFAALLLADYASKRVAERALQPPHVPHAVLGDLLRFTLTYNRGAAMDISAGEHSRLVFSAVAVVALVALAAIYRTTPAGARLVPAGLALVSAGALGNLLDRWRPAGAVVDFIDVGFGASRFWTFNVADAGVTVGAIVILLAQVRGGRAA